MCRRSFQNIFRDAYQFQATLAQRQGINKEDTSGKDWDIIEFAEVISSHTVKIVVMDVYTTAGNNGFVEVEFYGTECEQISVSKQHNWTHV